MHHLFYISRYKLSWVLKKHLKMNSGHFLTFHPIQMIGSDSKCVINRHVWFGSITSSGKGCNG